MNQPERAATIKRWRWTALILGTLTFGFGCTPGSLFMLFMYPFTDDKEPPAYELKTTKKEVTVVLNTTFARVEVRPELLAADTEINSRIAMHLRQRFQANKQPIKVISDAQTRQFLDQTGNALFAACEMGKQHKADYVINCEITSLSLKKEKSFGQLYEGAAEMHITVTKVEAGEVPDWETDYRCASSNPMHVNDISAAQYRAKLFDQIGHEVSRYFAPYPRDERHEVTP